MWSKKEMTISLVLVILPFSGKISFNYQFLLPIFTSVPSRDAA